MARKANGSVPLYQQVLQGVRADIEGGKYRPGDQIPTEDQLCEAYGVSRVTVRRALDGLVADGLLVRSQGRGTFVGRRHLTRKIAQSSDVRSFSDLCLGSGFRPGARVVERDVVPPTPDAEGFFGAGCGDLVHVVRVRTADGVPIMEESNYFTHDGPYDFLLEAALDDVSLFDTLRRETGTAPDRCRTSTIEAVPAGRREARALEVAMGDPLFLETAYLEDETGKPVCLSRKLLVGSRYVFRI